MKFSFESPAKVPLKGSFADPSGIATFEPHEISSVVSPEIFCRVSVFYLQSFGVPTDAPPVPSGGSHQICTQKLSEEC